MDNKSNKSKQESKQSTPQEKKSFDPNIVYMIVKHKDKKDSGLKKSNISMPREWTVYRLIGIIRQEAGITDPSMCIQIFVNDTIIRPDRQLGQLYDQNKNTKDNIMNVSYDETKAFGYSS